MSLLDKLLIIGAILSALAILNAASFIEKRNKVKIEEIQSRERIETAKALADFVTSLKTSLPQESCLNIR